MLPGNLDNNYKLIGIFKSSIKIWCLRNSYQIKQKAFLFKRLQHSPENLMTMPLAVFEANNVFAYLFIRACLPLYTFYFLNIRQNWILKNCQIPSQYIQPTVGKYVIRCSITVHSVSGKTGHVFLIKQVKITIGLCVSDWL